MSETTHQEIEEQFSSYYDGELEADKVEALEKHLATCDECKGAYDSFKDTVEAISGLGKVPAPVGFEQGVEQTIEKRSAGRFFGERKLTDRLPLTIIALTAIAIGVVLYLLLRTSETGSLKGGDAPELKQPVDREVIPKP